MRYYYIVDSFKQLHDAHVNGDCGHYEAVGTVHPDINDTDYPDIGDGRVAEVLAAVRFRDHGQQDRFEALSYVQSLGDPLDTDEMADDHLVKLQRFHPYRKLSPTAPAGATPNTLQMWCDISDSTNIKPCATKPHVRKLMTEHVGKMFSNFRFRIFD